MHPKEVKNSLRMQINAQTRQPLQTGLMKAYEKLRELPIIAIVDELKLWELESKPLSFAQIYDVILLQLRLCKHSLSQIIIQARQGTLTGFFSILIKFRKENGG